MCSKWRFVENYLVDINQSPNDDNGLVQDLNKLIGESCCIDFYHKRFLFMNEDHRIAHRIVAKFFERSLLLLHSLWINRCRIAHITLSDGM